MTMQQTRVTYTLEFEGKYCLIAHVPAHVRVETGEQFFAPETVEHIQAIVRSNRKPDRFIKTFVYEYACNEPIAP